MILLGGKFIEFGFGPLFLRRADSLGGSVSRPRPREGETKVHSLLAGRRSRDTRKRTDAPLISMFLCVLCARFWFHCFCATLWKTKLPLCCRPSRALSTVRCSVPPRSYKSAQNVNKLAVVVIIFGAPLLSVRSWRLEERWKSRMIYQEN